jgi:CRP/FNR family transcriptional regulator, cyclic AMP receptor protein
MNISEARAVLSARGWLTKTPAHFRDAVLSNCELRSFSSGETVYAQGDRSGGLWGLAAGTVGIELSGQHRDPSFAYFTGKGFWIGAHALVLGTERQVGLVALRSCSLLHLPGTAFHGITLQNQEAWRWLALLPLLQNTLAFGVLEDLLIRDTRRRCAAVLLRLAGCRGPLAATEPDDVYVTQEQLAGMINLSRTALGEVLRGFEAKGFISRQYGKLTIEVNQLEDMVNRF